MPRGIPLSAFRSWSEDDQGHALAWNRLERERCPQCGTRPGDWADDPEALLAQSYLCLGCEAVQQAQEEIREGARGVYIRLRPAADVIAETAEKEDDD